MIEAIQVSKRVRDGQERRDVLKDIQLAVSAGQMAILSGQSGSGKSTLLGLLGGVLLPTSGEIKIDGEAISRLREHHRAEVRRKKVGFVFQDFGLIESMTAFENVMLPLIPDGLIDTGWIKKVEEHFDAFDLKGRQNTKVSGLSGGERQRVALIRAIIRKPSVLLLDEPTAHLDSARVEALMDSVSNLAKEGAAIVVASHDERVLNDRRFSIHYTLVEGRLL